MANKNVFALAPTRSDDQILPFAAWVPIGKSSFVLDLQRKQKNPIFHISVDIMQNTNFFRAFTASASTFLVDNANLGNPTKKGKKTKPYVFPYCQFTKLIIYYLERHHNIHQRFGSPLNLAEDDLSLGNLKFIPKGEIDEVFGMQIPKELTMDNIRNAPYYNAYSSFQLVDESDKEQDQPGPKPHGVGEEYDLERAIQMSLESFQAHGQAHVGSMAIREPVAEAIRPLLVRRTPATKKASTGPSTQPQYDTSANILCETPSPANAETSAETDKVISKGDIEILNIDEEQGEDVDNKVYLEEQTAELDEGRDGSDLGKTRESRPPPDDDKMDEDQAGSNPKKVIWLLLDQTLSPCMMTSDQFFNDKSTEDEPRKHNVDAKVVSMVIVPILQASTSVHPLSTPIIDISPLKTDLPHKIDQTVNEVVKEAVHVAFQAPLRDRIRELPKADTKEILHQRMFESGSYKSLPEHCSAWKTSDTREAPSSSSKQQFAPGSKQPVEDVPILDDVNISDSKDIDTAHLPKIKTRPDWL
nr:hypothetical protein [Tanacetum cinerariifolium]